MLPLPRIALGTVQPNADLAPLSWALLDSLEVAGFHTQSFCSQAYLSPVSGARCITGQSQRHLDSWVMSKTTCREIFQHGSRASDLSLVEGRFTTASNHAQRSSLENLCEWLDLPAIAIIDVRQLSNCVLPKLPPGTVGMLLDGVRDTASACRWQTSLETLLGVPMLGYLDEATRLRELVHQRISGSPCQELCRALGRKLRASLRIDKLLKVAQARMLAASPQRLFVRNEGHDTIKIAVAFDDAFQGYFADTLDLMEARGATICDFSPLRGDALPWDANVVYLAGNTTEQFAEGLAKNHCMKQSLRNFVARGGRIFAEGGGYAYLCERLITADGRQHVMAGLLPAVAIAKPATSAAQPVEITFNQNNWLGETGTAVRGYLDNHWDILPAPGLNSFATDPDHCHDFVGSARIIASRLQVNFAGQPHLVNSFFCPRLGALVGVD
ncbi:MAG TPA: hypothetical protein VL096_08060 [Pirellulaceae bacterium]|nr:hypothetical protein [Pirellulaceae bacterium]